MALPGRPIRKFIFSKIGERLRQAGALLFQPGGTVTNADGSQDTTPKGILRSKSILAILFVIAQDAFLFDWTQLDFSNRAAIWTSSMVVWAKFGTAIGAIWWRITSTVPTTGPAANPPH